MWIKINWLNDIYHYIIGEQSICGEEVPMCMGHKTRDMPRIIERCTICQQTLKEGLYCDADLEDERITPYS